jgi:hypothetical protein
VLFSQRTYYSNNEYSENPPGIVGMPPGLEKLRMSSFVLSNNILGILLLVFALGLVLMGNFLSVRFEN